MEKSPIKQNWMVNRAFVFNKEEYPKLQTAQSKQTNAGQSEPQDTTLDYTPPMTTGAISTTALHKQIIADMKQHIMKIITTKISLVCTEITSKLTKLHSKISSKVHQVLQTIQTLNQWFTKVLDCLPQTTTMMPAHKKPKGLGIIN